MSDHVPGEMNITEQKKTFEGFIKVGVWLAVVVAIALIFLAIVGI
ncbi:MAG: aa3-type cytochrome c oxidase subunit IV [Pseudomonadota bacterium]